jgi:hypothetical protein
MPFAFSSPLSTGWNKNIIEVTTGTNIKQKAGAICRGWQSDKME